MICDASLTRFAAQVQAGPVTGIAGFPREQVSVLMWSQSLNKRASGSGVLVPDLWRVPGLLN